MSDPFDALYDDLDAIEREENERDRKERELEMARVYNNREAEEEVDLKGDR